MKINIKYEIKIYYLIYHNLFFILFNKRKLKIKILSEKSIKENLLGKDIEKNNNSINFSFGILLSFYIKRKSLILN